MFSKFYFNDLREGLNKIIIYFFKNYIIQKTIFHIWHQKINKCVFCFFFGHTCYWKNSEWIFVKSNIGYRCNYNENKWCNHDTIPICQIDEAWFSKFWILRILRAFFVFFSNGFFRVFSKISGILTPRTIKFGHKDSFYTKKMAQKKFRKFSIFRAFFRCFFIHKFKNDVFVHLFLSH